MPGFVPTLNTTCWAVACKRSPKLRRSRSSGAVIQSLFSLRCSSIRPTVNGLFFGLNAQAKSWITPVSRRLSRRGTPSTFAGRQSAVSRVVWLQEPHIHTQTVCGIGLVVNPTKVSQIFRSVVSCATATFFADRAVRILDKACSAGKSSACTLFNLKYLPEQLLSHHEIRRSLISQK